MTENAEDASQEWSFALAKSVYLRSNKVSYTFCDALVITFMCGWVTEPSVLVVQ
jgi:hypothetical protein